MKRLTGIFLIFVLMCLACKAQPAPQAESPAPEPTAVLTEAPTEVPQTEVPTPVPSAPPSDGSTPAPTEAPTPEPTPEPITAEMLDSGMFDSYFDDAVFVGDSMTKAFGYFITKQREQNGACLGSAHFMGVVSMTLKYAVTDTPLFTYRGKQVSLTDGLNQYGAKKVFIMIGANDLSFRDWSDVENDFRKIIDLIHEKCDGAKVILIGINPPTYSYCRNRDIDIAHWNSFNDGLRAICEEKGADFMTFASELMDEKGYLRLEYADGDLHLSNAGNTIWLRAVRIYAAKQLRPDAELLLSENESTKNNS